MTAPIFVCRRLGQRSAPWARLELAPGGLAFSTSYDDTLIAEFKARVPAVGRRWDPALKRWLVDAQYGTICAQLAGRILGVTVMVPAIASAPQSETRLLRIEYLGRCKDRDGGDPSAFGWADGGWNIIVPETALRAWFELDPPRPGEGRTLYAVLGVGRAASLDDIRSAYRRLAKVWHPDRCAESDAVEQFKQIQHAWEVLRDPIQSRKYAAGLTLSASIPTPTLVQGALPGQGYRSPLRCGWVLATGTNVLSRFAVEAILGWEDITRADGMVMSTSWPAGADRFEVNWV